MQLVSTGADGLVKLWGVRSAECTATFDEHEGKVAAPTALFTVLAGVVIGRQRVCYTAVRHNLYRTDAVPLLRFIALPAVHILGVLQMHYAYMFPLYACCSDGLNEGWCCSQPF